MFHWVKWISSRAKWTLCRDPFLVSRLFQNRHSHQWAINLINNSQGTSGSKFLKGQTTVCHHWVSQFKTVRCPPPAPSKIQGLEITQCVLGWASVFVVLCCTPSCGLQVRLIGGVGSGPASLPGPLALQQGPSHSHIANDSNTAYTNIWHPIQSWVLLLDSPSTYIYCLIKIV